MSQSRQYRVTLPSGITVVIPADQNLRASLKKHFQEIYAAPMEWVHCRGLGTCGTCAMKLVKGELSEPTKVEEWRLNFPPHKNPMAKGVRLLCQSYPLSDIQLEKLEGRWGQGSSEE